MRIDKDRAELLQRLVDRITSEMKSQDPIGVENVSNEVWWDTFIERIHPLLDDAIAEYALGSDDIFYMGAYFALRRVA
ncbi:MAG: hypothetical protein WCB91_07420 [Halobacteriota archaeon]